MSDPFSADARLRSMTKKLTAEEAKALAIEAGNRSMAQGERTTWNADDRRAAVREFVRLMPAHASMPEGFTR